MSFAISPKTSGTTQPATINNPSEIKPSATPFNTLAPEPASSLAHRPNQGKRPIASGPQTGGYAGTTPNSLENIGRRLAENLLLGGSQNAHPVNRIAPSYERRFSAGLGDLHRRLETYEEDPRQVLVRQAEPTESERTQDERGQASRLADEKEHFVGARGRLAERIHV